MLSEPLTGINGTKCNRLYWFIFDNLYLISLCISVSITFIVILLLDLLYQNINDAGVGPLIILIFLVIIQGGIIAIECCVLAKYIWLTDINPICYLYMSYVVLFYVHTCLLFNIILSDYIVDKIVFFSVLYFTIYIGNMSYFSQPEWIKSMDNYYSLYFVFINVSMSTQSLTGISDIVPTQVFSQLFVVIQIYVGVAYNIFILSIAMQRFATPETPSTDTSYSKHNKVSTEPTFLNKHMKTLTHKILNIDQGTFRVQNNGTKSLNRFDRSRQWRSLYRKKGYYGKLTTDFYTHMLTITVVYIIIKSLLVYLICINNKRDISTQTDNISNTCKDGFILPFIFIEFILLLFSWYCVSSRVLHINSLIEIQLLTVTISSLIFSYFSITLIFGLIYFDSYMYYNNSFTISNNSHGYWDLFFHFQFLSMSNQSGCGITSLITPKHYITQIIMSLQMLIGFMFDVVVFGVGLLSLSDTRIKQTHQYIKSELNKSQPFLRHIKSHGKSPSDSFESESLSLSSNDSNNDNNNDNINAIPTHKRNKSQLSLIHLRRAGLLTKQTSQLFEFINQKSIHDVISNNNDNQQ